MAFLFPLGKVCSTPACLEKISPVDMNAALARHAQGDWGRVEDPLANTAALKDGARLLSVYSDLTGTEFWILTEADRSVTTVLLPEDY